MKYNEAIDMIRDGGRAYGVDKEYEYAFIFDEIIGSSFLQMRDYGDVADNWRDPLFTACDFTATNWIVEKDGVVYEEYPKPKVGAFLKHIESRLNEIADKWIADLNSRISNASTLFIKDRAPEQDEPAELEENGEKWEEIKMPSVAKDDEYINGVPRPMADKLIEADNLMLEMNKRIEMLDKLISIQEKLEGDWLEKKISCVIKRREKQKFNVCFGNFDKIKCDQPKCPFCFPTDHIPDTSNMVENDHIEQPRDMVTVEDIEWLLEKYIEERDGQREAVANLVNAVFGNRYGKR